MTLGVPPAEGVMLYRDLKEWDLTIKAGSRKRKKMAISRLSAESFIAG
jgi:hypothetical protein